MVITSWREHQPERKERRQSPTASNSTEEGRANKQASKQINKRTTMSRSALWRQEAGKKEREQLAQDVFATALEEGRVSRADVCFVVGTEMQESFVRSRERERDRESERPRWSLCLSISVCFLFASARKLTSMSFRLPSSLFEPEQNNRIRGLLPLYGPDDTFNINPMLLQNISKTSYFVKKCCGQLRDWNALVDEIYYEVKHMEAWATGKSCKSCKSCC